LLAQADLNGYLGERQAGGGDQVQGLLPPTAVDQILEADALPGQQPLE
jgi:hypothetical protein